MSETTPQPGGTIYTGRYMHSHVRDGLTLCGKQLKHPSPYARFDPAIRPECAVTCPKCLKAAA